MGVGCTELALRTKQGAPGNAPLCDHAARGEVDQFSRWAGAGQTPPTPREYGWARCRFYDTARGVWLLGAEVSTHRFPLLPDGLPFFHDSSLFRFLYLLPLLLQHQVRLCPARGSGSFKHLLGRCFGIVRCNIHLPGKDRESAHTRPCEERFALRWRWRSRSLPNITQHRHVRAHGKLGLTSVLSRSDGITLRITKKA